MDTTTQKEESEMATDVDYSARGITKLFVDHAANQKHNEMSYVELRLRPFTGETGMEQTIRMEIPGQPATEFWTVADHIIHSLYVHRDKVDKTDMYIEVINGDLVHPGYEHHGGHNPSELANWGVTVKEAIETALRQVGPDFFSNERELRLMAGFDTPCSQGGLAPHWTQCRDHAAKAAGWTQIRWEDAAYELS